MHSVCPHFVQRKSAILQRYEVLLRRIVFPLSRQDNHIKASLVKCAECNGTRLYSLLCCCLECATFACLAHLKLHLHSKGHFFAVSTHHGELFCTKCNDFVYERRLEKIRGECNNLRRKKLGLSLQHRWNPGQTEVDLCRRSSIVRLPRNDIRGLRGLVNLGNTCFMNCIVGSFIEQHIRMSDFFRSKPFCIFQCYATTFYPHHCRSGPLALDRSANACLMCELMNIFQEFYGSEGNSPFVPHRLLHLVWTHAKQLAGYEQHDAHEFLISALNILHRHSESTSMKQNPHDCKCIIDRLFTGRLQSDLTCTRCRRISTTVDPYWDISLELVNGIHHAEPITGMTTTGRMAALGSAAEQQEAAVVERERSLDECLENFVRPENLGHHSKIKCDNCGTYEVQHKQLTLRKLPIVACFHLKRFEHMNAAKRQKIKYPVRYPEFIDLTPYTTSYRNSVLSGALGQEVSQRRLTSLTNRYSLFAVVNHNGSTESGHYSCYIRHQHDSWYNCNDQKITRENVENVLASEGYLLFYCKSYLDYD